MKPRSRFLILQIPLFLPTFTLVFLSLFGLIPQPYGVLLPFITLTVTYIIYFNHSKKIINWIESQSEIK